MWNAQIAIRPPATFDKVKPGINRQGDALEGSHSTIFSTLHQIYEALYYFPLFRMSQLHENCLWPQKPSLS